MPLEDFPRVAVTAAIVCVALPALLNMSYLGRGGTRRSLPQILARKVEDDRALFEDDKSDWYGVDKEVVDDKEFAAKFVRLGDDDETREFIEQSVDKSDSFLTQLWHNLAKSVMKLFYYSQTDINGYLGRGSMFVLSKEHFRTLARSAGFDLEQSRLERMIDLGAGDGCPTAAFTPFFREVYATEASKAMRGVLAAKDISVLEIDSWHADDERKFDFVACLNLLDRCAEPLTVLDQIKSSLKPGSDAFVIVALVLPVKPYVEFDTADHKPIQKMGVIGDTFEAQAESAAKMLEARGFEVLSWSRVPYLSEGDLEHSIYRLDDSIFVIRPKQ